MKKHKIKNRHLARVVDMVLSLNRLDVPVYAANAAYFIILAAFPTVMLLLNLLSYTSLGGGALLEILEKVIPSALMPSITRLLTGMFASSSKTLVSVSALAALWAASRGIFGMLTGLNRIYNVQEDRGYVFTRLLSLVYTFLFPSRVWPDHPGPVAPERQPCYVVAAEGNLQPVFGAASPADGAVYRHVYVSPQPAEQVSPLPAWCAPGLPGVAAVF
ncbi:MAG: hypothetical protein BHW33_03195 [Firmicutes bacterium CAG:137_57_8]|nr:MAG: hypothetical protein BHW33_03195 [Firmicutes bacterium CAG:137_57_8]